MTVHVGDIGTVFEVTVYDGAAVMNISTSTVRQIIFKKPDGTRVANSAVLSSTGVDGKMKYTTTLNTEINLSGTWSIQARVVTAQGDWNSSIGSFIVEANI